MGAVVFDDLLTVIALVNLGCAVICFRKGKPLPAVFGVIGVVPMLAYFGIPAWVGAARAAKPGSAWTKRGQPPQRPDGSSKGPGEPRPLTEEETIRRFLDAATEAEVVDLESLGRLRDFLTRSTPEPEPAVAPPTPVSEAAPTPPTIETEPRVPPVEITRTPTPPAPDPSPQPPLPAAQPSRLSVLLSRTWEAAASDIALHGLSYLGVVLTFIGVLGFLLFAFADVPDAVQPVVELVIAFIFFGWAWMLRRQNATRVASGMELTGGMVVPLIVFASLVDNAPLPPDFTGNALVVALPAASLILAFLYAWISKRNLNSTLKYLVFPLLWLGALAAGFAFKTDEPLVGPAITRLVSPQPALAAVAIGLTLAWFLTRRDHRLADPTINAALVGAPFAYLIAISLSVGEGWVRTWPIVVLGAATLVSAEALAAWYSRQDWMAGARPLLLAGVLVPVSPSIDGAWLGVVAFVLYAALVEVELRRRRETTVGLWLALSGAVLGLVMSLGEPVAALITFGIGSIWTHLRRLAEDRDNLKLVFTWTAALLPLGVLFSLDGLIGAEAALLAMAGVVLAMSVAVRYLAVEDVFWVYWLASAGGLLTVLAVVSWLNGGMNDVRQPVSVLVVAVVLAVAPGWPMFRLWLTAGTTATALTMLLETAGVAFDIRQIIWSAAGLAAVASGVAINRVLGAHIAAIGHIASTAAAASLVAAGPPAPVLGGWALGWLVAAFGDERGRETVTSLLARIDISSGDTGWQRLVAWIVPTFAVVSIPPALLAGADLWAEFGEHRSWTGVLVATIGLGYALMGRLARTGKQLRRLLTWGAIVASIIGVSIAPPDAWPTIYAAAAVISVAFIVSRDLGLTWFTWFAWTMTVVVALLLAGQLGVEGESLHLVSLVWGGIILIGGLIFDDTRSGRRERGEGLRTPWLRFPVIIGGLTVPVSLGPAFVNQPEVFGWWAIGASVVYFVVAWLTKAGAITAPAYALAALGLAVVIPWSVVDDPWLLVWIALPMVVISWLAGVRQNEGTTGWMRWDLAPLVVSQGVGALALTFGAVGDGLAAAALAFGALAMTNGLVRGGRTWVEIGNLMILLGAWDQGFGWLAVALVATSVRGMIEAARASEGSRDSYQAISVAGAGLAWPSFLAWSGLSPSLQADYSMLLFGGGSLVVAVLARRAVLGRDTAIWWGSLAIVGVFATLLLANGPQGEGIQGPLVAVGMALAAIAAETAWRVFDPALRYLAILLTIGGWAALAAGLNWDQQSVAMWTSIVAGAGTAAIGELTRIFRPGAAEDPTRLAVARAWGTTAASAVVLSTFIAYQADALVAVGFANAGGLAITGFASARATEALRLEWLRDVAAISVLSASMVAAAAVGLSDSLVAVVAVVGATAGTLVALAIWRRSPASLWIRPVIVAAVAANVIAVGIAFAVLDTALWIGVLLAVGIQAIAIGLVRSDARVLAVGPPALGLAFVLTVGESVSGSAQWFSIPAGLALLAEVEIFRSVPLAMSKSEERNMLAVLEWIGLGVLAAPPLVEMFTVSLFAGLIALAIAALAFVWGVATKVRRRVVSAAALAVASMVMVVFAAAAGRAPDSAFFWIVAIGVGFAVMLVAGLVEAYRSKKGRTMARLDRLMEGWE